jgi:dienelactone hydrolase
MAAYLAAANLSIFSFNQLIMKSSIINSSFFSFILAASAGGLASSCAGSSYATLGATATSQADWESITIKADTSRVVDLVRHRPIPLVTYVAVMPSGAMPHPPQLKVALLNHAYHGKNTEYLFLAKNLAAHGYYVVSLQHELPGDEPIAMLGNLRETRRPNWERGVQNMRCVLQELRRTHPALDYRHLLLMGHSNGGDMAALFAEEYPKQVDRLISFDNRRMPLPRAYRPRVLSLRSSDQPADAGVLPTPAEQAKFGMTIVQLPATVHNDMWDGATIAQQREMNAFISNFLIK